jgi:hypothetical protein
VHLDNPEPEILQPLLAFLKDEKLDNANPAPSNPRVEAATCSAADLRATLTYFHNSRHHEKSKL